MMYADRRDAGRQLAQHLSHYANRRDVLVLALPRGGVPVAFEVAQALHLQLDVFLVRKLGVPGHEELAMGAIASGGARVYNRSVLAYHDIDPVTIERVAEREKRELERREQAYRTGRADPLIAGRQVILVDDGLATGASMQAAIAAMRNLHPGRLIVAVPIAAPDTCRSLRELVDEVVCAATPWPFYGVGQWYEDFSQTTDEEVRDLLALAAGNAPPVVGGASPKSESELPRPRRTP